jgi:hypothetical protein
MKILLNKFNIFHDMIVIVRPPLNESLLLRIRIYSTAVRKDQNYHAQSVRWHDNSN